MDHPEIFDKDVLDELRALDPDGSDETVRLIMSTFVEVTPPELAKIVHGCRAQDATAVRASAHRLKGSARTIGARQLGDVCEAVEQDPARGMALLDELEARAAEALTIAGQLAAGS